MMKTISDFGTCPAYGTQCEYVSIVEAQAAEIEKFSGIAKLAILKAYDTNKFSTATIEAQAAEIERLKERVKELEYEVQCAYEDMAGENI